MNDIRYAGTIVSDIVFSHESCGEKFLQFFVSSNRLSGVADCVKVIAPELLVRDYAKNDNICIVGEIRTRGYEDEEKRKLDVFVFARLLEQYEIDENFVSLQGFVVSKQPQRQTKQGREITDFTVASNRGYHKSDYIPCIAWSRTAKRVDEMSIGTQIILEGRLQSREYIKVIDGEPNLRIAFELSVARIWEDVSNG